jgi:hypothetical protein
LRLHREQPGLELEPLLRAALKLLTPSPSSPGWPRAQSPLNRAP